MEWTVITTLAVLVPLGIAIVAPIVKLNKTIATLAVTVDNLGKTVAGIEAKNNKSHDKMWCRLDEHDDALSSHETRITVLEKHN